MNLNLRHGLPFSFIVFSSLLFILAPNVGGKLIDDSLMVEKIFYANKLSGGDLEIYKINPDGTGRTKVVTNAGDDCAPTLSPDGKKIAFYRHGADSTSWSEYVMNADGSGITRLTNVPNVWDYEPSWSPDGKRIAFGRIYPLENYRAEIWLMNADGTNQRKIGSYYGNCPVFSPDGKKFVFEGLVGSSFHICTADTNGANFKKLTTAGTSNSFPAFSPDGSKIAFQSNRDGNDEIYIMDADGANVLRLTNNSAEDGVPSFSPDGRKIVFTSLRDGKYEVYTMNNDGTNQVRLTTFGERNIQPDWAEVKVPFPKYLGQTPPDTLPKRFGGYDLQSDGSWWWHGAPTFSPDGKEMFMVKYNSAKPSGNMEIYYMKLVNGVWSGLLRPSFAGDSCDTSPVYSSDGNSLFFLSNRSGAIRMYKVNRTVSGWDTPEPVNINYPQIPGSMGWCFAFTADRTLYFSIYETNGYVVGRSKLLNGGYSVFEVLPAAINAAHRESTPCPDPNEKYLIFESAQAGGYGFHDLYISFKDGNGSWLPAVNLGNMINGEYEDAMAALSPDGKYLFFNSAKAGDYGYNAYWVDIKCIDKFKPLTAVESRKSGAPSGFLLENNFPNPFNPSTSIRCFVPVSVHAKLVVYDVLGKEVRTLHNGELAYGQHEFTWDGNDNRQNAVPGGVYFFRFTGGEFSKTQKAVYLK